MPRSLSNLASVLFGVVAVLPVHAATIVVAVGEGDWADAATWSPNPPTAADTVVVNADRILNVTTDVSAVTPARLFVSNQADSTRTGTLNILSGGKVGFGSVIVSTNSNTGRLNILGGALVSDGFIKIGNVEGSNATITVVGGQMAAGGSLTVGAAGSGLLVIDGVGSTIAAPNATVGGGTSGIVEFRFDAAGVSPLLITNYFNAASGTLVVDGARYQGGSATVRLIEAKFTNPSSSPFGTVDVKGFGPGYSAELAYSDTAIDLVITASDSVAKWSFWNIVDSDYVDTEAWMGWLKVSDDPWIYSYSLNSYLYLPADNVGESGGWMYVLN